MSEEKIQSLKTSLKGQQPLVGTFLKTPHHQVVEILALTGLDFIVLDAEHAPFDRADIDRCLLAARANNLPALVRIPNISQEVILSVLDLGASGILAPHINTRAEAEIIARAARYRNGTRGFSGSSRAGHYGNRSANDHIERSDADVIVIAQIEESEAVGNIAEISDVPGIDAVFIGRADMMVSLGADSLDSPAVNDAVTTICRKAIQSKMPVGMFLGSPAQVAGFRQQGVSFFIIGSDQALLKGASSNLSKMFYDNTRE